MYIYAICVLYRGIGGVAELAVVEKKGQIQILII